jgi:hypothetical protein
MLSSPSSSTNKSTFRLEAQDNPTFDLLIHQVRPIRSTPFRD